MLKRQYVHMSNFPYMYLFLSFLIGQFLCLLPDTLFFLESFCFFQKHELIIRHLLHRLQVKKINFPMTSLLIFTRYLFLPSCFIKHIRCKFKTIYIEYSLLETAST